MRLNNGSALGTLVERTTRMTFLVQLKDKDATTVRETFAKEFKHLPKGTDFSKVSLKNIKQAQDMLNDRPRKTLGFLTPHEVFSKLLY